MDYHSKIAIADCIDLVGLHVYEKLITQPKSKMIQRIL
jgi:hypothetical protein